MSIKLKKLNKTIIKCKKCPRLTNFIKKISSQKRKENIINIAKYIDSSLEKNLFINLLNKLCIFTWELSNL